MGAIAGSGVLLARCAANSIISADDPIASTVLRSENGVLNMTLVAEQQRVPLAGRSASLLTYNGQYPGPTLELRPGDTVRIRLVNRLSQPTNLHYHGLHVSPEGNADNPFLHIAPGESFDYEFTLSPDHPTGLFWYHPHHHGHVAEQVAGGLVGLMVIRGDLDDMPELQSAEEAFAVLQDFELDDEGQLVSPAPMWAMWGREGSLLTVNGQNNPTFSLPLGELLRLRLVNASPSRIYRLALEDHSLHVIALDGITLASPTEVDEVLMSPGQRADVLVRGDRPPGQYALMTLPYDRGIGSMMNGMMGTMTEPGQMGQGRMGSSRMGHRQGHSPMQPLQHLNDTPQPLATLAYQTSGTEQSTASTALSLIPSTLPVPHAYSPDFLPEPQTKREFIFDHGMDHQTGAAFLINGQGFAPNRVDVSVPLDRVEDWTLINNAGMDHPFHLHVHPFQVISRNGQREAIATWRDTVMVKGYERVTIRIPFRHYPGKTVYHCHILDHEDKGMMGIVDVGV